MKDLIEEWINRPVRYIKDSDGHKVLISLRTLGKGKYIISRRTYKKDKTETELYAFTQYKKANDFFKNIS